MDREGESAGMIIDFSHRYRLTDFTERCWLCDGHPHANFSLQMESMCRAVCSPCHASVFYHRRWFGGYRIESFVWNPWLALYDGPIGDPMDLWWISIDPRNVQRTTMGGTMLENTAHQGKVDLTAIQHRYQRESLLW